MKNITILLALMTSATLTAVACGDDEPAQSNPGKGGSSGASGSGGTAGGGATGGDAGSGATGGSAGASGGSAGAAGTAGGGAGGMTGGTAGEGGVGADGGVGAEGGMGQGGDGPGPGTCPAAEPMPMTMCGTRGLSCDFGDRICRCNVTTGNWNCFDQGGDCPDMPDPDGDCMGMMTACSYGEQGTCVCQMGNFNCDDGVVECPATRPMDGAGCNMFPAMFECDYPAGACTCQGAGPGGGMMRDWNCE